MHQSILAAPPPPPVGLQRGIARLVSPGGGAFVGHFALLGGWAFANPGANPGLLSRMRFPIRIELHRGFYWNNKQIGSFVKDGKKLKRFLQNYIAKLGSY